MHEFRWGLALIFFLLGGTLLSIVDFFIAKHAPCGGQWYSLRQCAQASSYDKLAQRGLDIPIAHDGEPVVTIPIAQSLDGNNDGLPDQPLLWELPHDEKHDEKWLLCQKEFEGQLSSLPPLMPMATPGSCINEDGSVIEPDFSFAGLHI